MILCIMLILLCDTKPLCVRWISDYLWPSVIHIIHTVINLFFNWLNKCMCVCVCVCVCLHSSTCWFLLAARHLWRTWDDWINNLLLWVLLGSSAKFPHLHFRISFQPSTYWREKKWYNAGSTKRWYILI